MKQRSTAAQESAGTTTLSSVIFVITTLLLLGLELYAINVDSHYQYDIIFCFIGAAGAYRYRFQLQLSSLEFILVVIFLMTHAIGVFHLYETYPLGIEYDFWVHGLFGFVAVFISIPLIRSITHYSFSVDASCALILILGLAALHELYEFAGAVLLGEGEGVLFIGAGDLDQWDTQKDILNNLIGGLIGVFVSYFRTEFRPAGN